jgi:hypothetical protein
MPLEYNVESMPINDEKYTFDGFLDDEVQGEQEDSEAAIM